MGERLRAPWGAGRLGRWIRPLRRMLVVLWVGAIVIVARAAVSRADSIEVNPTWGDAPGVEKVERILNVTAQTSLVCCVLSGVIGGGILGLGKIFGGLQSGNTAAKMIFGGGGGALIITLSARIIGWLISDPTTANA